MQRKAIVKRYFDEALSRGNLRMLDEILDPDIVVYPPAYLGEPLRGIEALRGWFVALRHAFPDFRFMAGAEVEEGDMVASAFRMQGSHQGEYMGLAATGEKIDLKGVDLFKFKGDRISEIHIYYDTLGLVSQLGVVKWPPQPAARA